MAAPLSNKLDWESANPIWASSLNPLIANPINNAKILNGVTLSVGTNIINHGLGMVLNGWFLTDIRGPATVYRSAPMNSTTLTLTSDAEVICNLGVF